MWQAGRRLRGERLEEEIKKMQVVLREIQVLVTRKAIESKR